MSHSIKTVGAAKLKTRVQPVRPEHRGPAARIFGKARSGKPGKR